MSYLEYWGLKKNPFDSVPDPGMYFSSHSTVENTVAELLFAIEEGNECLAVVVGQVGLGKTMALRVVLDSLDEEKYSIAFITNPDLTFIQILREIIGQLSGEKCTTRAKDALLEEFNRILFETADTGRKVLVFIDEGNAMRPRNLEKLRLLTNMQEDTRNLLTLIIAGQPKLGHMLHHPDRANLFQRIGVYAQLEPLAAGGVVRDYIEHRLERAGRREPIFDESAYQAIYDHSGGVPRLINRVSKLALKAGETNEFSSIDGEIIRAIAARFESSATSPKTRPSPAPAPREKESAERKESRPAESGKQPETPAPTGAEKPRAAAAEAEKPKAVAPETGSQRVPADEPEKPRPAATGDRTEAHRPVVRTQQDPSRTPSKESGPPATAPNSAPVPHEIHISAQHSKPARNGSSDHRLSSSINREGFEARPENHSALPPVPDSSRRSQESREDRKQPHDSEILWSESRRSEPAGKEFRPSEVKAPKPSPRPALEESALTAAPSPSVSTPSVRPKSVTAEAPRSATGPTEAPPGIETKPSRETARPEAAAAEVRPESILKSAPAEPRRFQTQPQPAGKETSDAEKWDVAKDVLEQLRQISDSKDRLRLAGQMAAREISEHPERYHEAHTDPVRIWDELRTQIMRMAL